MNKIKYNFEYIFKTTPQSLFSFISTPSGLAQWFADNVTREGSENAPYFTVWWGKTTSRIRILSLKNNKEVRYCWEEDEGSDYYFDLSIKYDELTKVVSLKVIDFAEEGEFEDLKSIWDLNIKRLKKKIGSL